MPTVASCSRVPAVLHGEDAQDVARRLGSVRRGEKRAIRPLAREHDFDGFVDAVGSRRAREAQGCALGEVDAVGARKVGVRAQRERTAAVHAHTEGVVGVVVADGAALERERAAREHLHHAVARHVRAVARDGAARHGDRALGPDHGLGVARTVVRDGAAAHLERARSLDRNRGVAHGEAVADLAAVEHEGAGVHVHGAPMASMSNGRARSRRPRSW